MVWQKGKALTPATPAVHCAPATRRRGPRKGPFCLWMTYLVPFTQVGIDADPNPVSGKAAGAESAVGTSDKSKANRR